MIMQYAFFYKHALLYIIRSHPSNVLLKGKGSVCPKYRFAQGSFAQGSFAHRSGSIRPTFNNQGDVYVYFAIIVTCLIVYYRILLKHN